MIVLMLPNLAKSVLFNRVMLEDDTRTQAKSWIEKNVPPGSKIAMDSEFYSPPLGFSAEQLNEKREMLERMPHFQSARARRLDYLIHHPADAPSYGLYILSDEWSEGDPQFVFQKSPVPFGLKHLRKSGIDFVISAKLKKWDLPRPFYEDLNESGQLIASFNPYRDSMRDRPFQQPLTGGPFLWKDLKARERNGMPLRVYQL